MYLVYEEETGEGRQGGPGKFVLSVPGEMKESQSVGGSDSGPYFKEDSPQNSFLGDLSGFNPTNIGYKVKGEGIEGLLNKFKKSFDVYIKRQSSFGGVSVRELHIRTIDSPESGVIEGIPYARRALTDVELSQVRKGLYDILTNATLTNATSTVESST